MICRVRRRWKTKKSNSKLPFVQTNFPSAGISTVNDGWATTKGPFKSIKENWYWGKLKIHISKRFVVWINQLLLDRRWKEGYDESGSGTREMLQLQYLLSPSSCVITDRSNKHSASLIPSIKLLIVSEGRGKRVTWNQNSYDCRTAITWYCSLFHKIANIWRRSKVNITMGWNVEKGYKNMFI